MNDDKTKIIKLHGSDEDPRELKELTFEKDKDFKYLCAILCTKNGWANKIDICLNKTKTPYFALTKNCQSKPHLE